MLRRLRYMLLGLLGVAVLWPATLWATISTSFDQVDYTQGGATSVADSAWGEFDVTYDQSSSLQWINVVANPGTAGASWIVQNQPLLSTGLTGTSSYTSSSYFDLGVAPGTEVSSLSILTQISSTPLTGAPSSGSLSTVGVGVSQDIIDNGVPSGLTALNTPSGVPAINWVVPFVGLQADMHAGMPNVVQELNFCGPGAAANSLQWLNTQNKLGLQQPLLTIQSELAGNMMNTNNGNWDDKEAQGKLQYIIEHQLPLEVHYTGGVKLPTIGDFAAPNGNGTARNDGAVTWDWLQQQIEQGQDVELMTNTHWVVMDGFLSWDNIHLISYRDDPFQHGAATTAAEQAIINNRHVWTYFSNGDIDIGNGNEKLGAAIAESPIVPEPGTWLLLTLGVMGLGMGYRRRPPMPAPGIWA